MKNFIDRLKGQVDEYEELYDDLDEQSYETDTAISPETEWNNDLDPIVTDKALAVEILDQDFA